MGLRGLLTGIDLHFFNDIGICLGVVRIIRRKQGNKDGTRTIGEDLCNLNVAKSEVLEE
jgi:hypothetical protein